MDNNCLWKCFKEVILVSNIASDFGYNNEKEIAVQHNGCYALKDGLGSFG